MDRISLGHALLAQMLRLGQQSVELDAWRDHLPDREPTREDVLYLARVIEEQTNMHKAVTHALMAWVLDPSFVEPRVRWWSRLRLAVRAFLAAWRGINPGRRGRTPGGPPSALT